MNDSHDKSNNGNDNNSKENAQKCAILEQLNCKERGGLGFVFDPVVPGKGVPPELMLGLGKWTNSRTKCRICSWSGARVAMCAFRHNAKDTKRGIIMDKVSKAILH